MDRKVLGLAIAALLIGSGVGTTVGTVTAKPATKTVTVVKKKKGRTRTVTQTVTQTETVTETTTVTDTGGRRGGGAPNKYTDCPDQNDEPNCVPPDDEYNPPADFCDTHNCIDTFWDGSGYATMCNDYLWSLSGGIQGRCSSHGGDSGYPTY